MSGIKIRLIKIDGEDRVPPACMRLLREIAAHRDGGKQCYRAFYEKTAAYCPTGLDLARELAAQPEDTPMGPEDFQGK